jgi:hypothetical protein
VFVRGFWGWCGGGGRGEGEGISNYTKRIV